MSVHFSSKKDNWTTPREFFNALNRVYKFTLDVCADDHNHLCDSYFTEKKFSLNGGVGRPCQLLYEPPPYGRKIGEFIEKCYRESKNNGRTIVMLLPARTDTRWFHDFCLYGDVSFVKGRLKFGDGKNAAPFPSMVVVFDNLRDYGGYDRKGLVFER